MKADLPPLPRRDWADNGYDWMEELRGGWCAVPAWGRDGWDLLDWPHAVAAHFDGEERYGLAVYEEGDVTVQSFRLREDRDAATNRIAVQYWRNNGRGPNDLPSSNDDLAAHHLGPFSRVRMEREGQP